MKYQKRFVDKAILMALQDLGGSASREMIRKTIAENQYDGLRYEDVYASKDENHHTPFMEDFTAAMICMSLAILSSSESARIS